MHKTGKPPWALLLVAYIAVWLLASWLRSPSLDSYGDMVENYAWGQTWEWGSFKHPPLFAWLVRLWFSVFPTEVWAYFLLSYVNAAVGALGIVALAALWLPPSLDVRRDNARLLALLFALASLPYANLAAKFNADTVLLSLWPWTAVCFFRAARPGAALGWSVALGALAAAAMLGKYFSGVLLLSLFLISFLRPWRSWYASPRPYVALAVFAALLAPHVYWEWSLDFPFRQYLSGKFAAGDGAARMVSFALSAFYYWALPWLAFVWLWRRWQRHATVLAPVFPHTSLVALTLLPAAITLALHVLLGIHLTTHWAIPLWFALPALFTLWLLPKLPETPLWPQARRAVYGVALLILVGSAGYVASTALRGKASYYYSRQALVAAVEAAFAERYPGATLRWVGGTWAESASFAFFAPSHPRALPGVPDAMPALVNPHPTWAREHGAILCTGTYGTGRDAACEMQAEAWLTARGAAVLRQEMVYRAQGWRYPRPQEKRAVVYWVAPLRQ